MRKIFVYTVQSALIQESVNQLPNLKDGLRVHIPQSRSRQLSTISWYIIFQTWVFNHWLFRHSYFNPFSISLDVLPEYFHLLVLKGCGRNRNLFHLFSLLKEKHVCVKYLYSQPQDPSSSAEVLPLFWPPGPGIASCSLWWKTGKP